MLVLSRKVGQQVFIGRGIGSIVLNVVEIRRGEIRLGIAAPRDVPIFRGELLDKQAPVEMAATAWGAVPLPEDEQVVS